MSSETPTRDPMRDPRPGDRLEDYYFGICTVQAVKSAVVTVLWERHPIAKRAKSENFYIHDWRRRWDVPRLRIGATYIGRVLEVADA